MNLSMNTSMFEIRGSKMNAMNRMRSAIAEKAELSKKDAEKALKSFTDLVVVGKKN